MATVRPPFQTPVQGVSSLPGPWQALKVKEYMADGNEKCWPSRSEYVPFDDRIYKIKLARVWAQQLGVTQPGVNYYLEHLPHGYGVFESRQPGGPQIYKRLFGHPTGRYYDSILKFEPHFLWLVSGKQGDCECTLCGKPRDRPPKLPKPRQRRERIAMDDPEGESSSASGLAYGRERRHRGLGPTYPVDEEGTRNVYKECIQSLYKNRDSRQGIKMDILEEDSMDHEAEHEVLTQYLTRIEQQHSFVPRIAELVLWCNHFPDDHFLLKDPRKNDFKFYSFKDKAFHWLPDWRAGVVTQVPISTAVDGAIDFPDILDFPKKKTSLNQSGFRVETVPDPNNWDKSLSKQYRYVPLRNIRPLTHWQYTLHGFPQKKLHPSIYNALTLMTSLSLLEKYEFRGEWPNGSILCKGIYIGSELITLGDVIRITSDDQEDDEDARDILIVDSIRMNLLDIQAEHVTVEAPLLSSQTNITLIGSAFTNLPHSDYRAQGMSDAYIFDNIKPIDGETAKHLFRPVGTNDYGPWYRRHSPTQRFEISYEKILGRLHEPIAVKLWTGHEQFRLESGQDPTAPNFNFDVPGIVAGRRYATQTDARIPLPPDDKPDQIMWHLADYRGQGLDIASSNGLDIGPYDTIRTKETLERWRNVLKVRRGDMSAAKELVISHQRGRPAGTRVIDGKLVEVDEAEGIFDHKVASRVKRRGRPSGSKLVDGKLVLASAGQQSQGMKSAAREETDSEVSSDDKDTQSTDNGNSRAEFQRSMLELGVGKKDVEEMLPTKLQRIGSSDQHEEEDDDDTTDPTQRPTSSSKDKGKAPLRTAPLTKEQIMRSIETGDLADDEEESASDQEEDWSAPPVIRGGTEESEGGDYDPKKEAQQERAAVARKSKERKEQQHLQPLRPKSKEKSKEKDGPAAGSGAGGGYRPWVKDWYKT